MQKTKGHSESPPIPPTVMTILMTHDPDADAYAECRRMVDQLELIGWTADWGLDGELYDLKRIYN